MPATSTLENVRQDAKKSPIDVRFHDRQAKVMETLRRLHVCLLKCVSHGCGTQTGLVMGNCIGILSALMGSSPEWAYTPIGMIERGNYKQCISWLNDQEEAFLAMAGLRMEVVVQPPVEGEGRTLEIAWDNWMVSLFPTEDEGHLGITATQIQYDAEAFEHPPSVDMFVHPATPAQPGAAQNPPRVVAV